MTNRDVNCLIRTEIYEMKYDGLRVCFRIPRKFKQSFLFLLKLSAVAAFGASFGGLMEKYGLF